MAAHDLRRHRLDRYPLSSRYDPAWLLELDMGPHPLWQLEELLRDLPLEPGSRVLDLGAGRGATSVFLAREFDVQVVAVDLWVGRADLAHELARAGVDDRVTAVHADVRDLPFDSEEFDAIVSVDAFEYFGTDVRLLPALLRVLRAGGRLGMTTPALRHDPYDVTPPPYVTDVVGGDAAAWHAPDWWATHWSLSGLVTDVRARMIDGGREDWLAWQRVVADVDDPVTTMLTRDEDDELGFAVVTATKTREPEHDH